MSDDKIRKKIYITLGQCQAMVDQMHELDAEFFLFYEDSIMDDLNTIYPYHLIDPNIEKNDLN